MILVAILLMLGYASRDALWPGTPVDVVRVLAKDAPTAEQAEQAVASAPPMVSAQAPGWIEPDPFPVYVSALADGVVQEVLVLEGETVRAGQRVTNMVADDAELSVTQAKAELARQQALLEAAKTDLENPVALDRDVEVNRARVEESRATEGQLRSEVAAQQARLEGYRLAYNRLRTLSAEAVSKQDVEDAEYRHKTQLAAVTAAEDKVKVMSATVRRQEVEVVAAERAQRLKVKEKKAVAEATAQVDKAASLLEEAELRLRRMQVVSPAAGVVMRRLVSPGSKVMLRMDGDFSAHIVHLYDPKKLQVRVDVPLADAAKVGVGQSAIIEVDALPEVEFKGEVSRLVHQADIGKNTVQVKVAIHEPLPMLKPDMLARVKFFARQGGDSIQADGSGLQLLLPQSAVIGQGDSAAVWLVDVRDSRVIRRKIKLHTARGDGWAVVTSGLNPGDVLVADPSLPLTEGQRVRINNKLK